MNLLDIPTGFLIVGFLFLLAPAGGWLVLGTGRSRAVALWCGGGLLFGLGMLLIGGRAVLPVWLSYTTAITLAFLGLTMKASALVELQGGRWPLHWLVVVALLHGAVFEELRSAGLSQWRFAWSATSLAALFALIGWRAQRLSKPLGSRSAAWLGTVYLAGSVPVGLRVVAVMAGHTDPDAVTPGLASVSSTVVCLVLAVVGTMAFVGIFLDRARQHEVQTAAEQARRSETARLGAQIARMERQHVMNELSATLAHELNQPLTATLTNAQLARHMAAHSDGQCVRLVALMDDIERDTQRASEVVRRVRNFVRTGTAEREPVDLRRTVQEVLHIVAGEARETATALNTDLPADPVTVHGDPVQLAQVLLNLVLNALQAGAGTRGNRIDLRLWAGHGTAVITVRDHGTGIAPEHLAQVGTPFYTTKPEGTGLGLSIARALVEQHGGSLVLRNAPGGGAVVMLSLPCDSPVRT